MDPLRDSDIRWLWIPAAMGGGIVAALAVEIVAVGVGLFTPSEGFLVGVATSIPFAGGLLYGSYRIARIDFGLDRCDRVARWCLGGAIAFLVIYASVLFTRPPETSFAVVNWSRWAISIGGGTGLLVGFFEAQALERKAVAEESRARQVELKRERDRLDQFADTIAHDLRSPLNVASGHLALAQEEADSDHLNEAQAALERMESILEDTLTLAREGRTVGETSEVDFGTVATQCWATVDGSDGKLSVEDRATIRADSDRLKHVFENLFANAAEHGGADVTIRVGVLDGADGFYVADDGPGIPAGDRERVFEMGYSGDDAGTGFGLAIVRRIVDAHGWEITVTESADGGARFEITGVEFVD